MLRLICTFALLATGALAQPAEFDPSDFGKIVIQPRQMAGGVTLEQAFGDYQNEPVIDYGENSQAVRLGRPVGRLDMLFADGRTGFCTAFIVDQQHLLTNHHCIPGMDGDPTGAQSGVQAAQFVAGYIRPGRAQGADRYTVSPQIVETNRALDYTVLRVFGDPSAKYGMLELADADPEDAEFLWIIGHPQGQSQHISREGCAAASPSISEEGKLVHTCDTLQGNSGSPVLRITDRRVVGLHHAGDSRTGFNQAIPMRRILAVSKVLAATGAPVVAPPVVKAPDPAEDNSRTATRLPVLPQPRNACDALWDEAKEMGCAGYEAYVEDCADHTFARLARRVVERDCSAPDDGVTAETGPVLTVRAQGGGDHRSIVQAVLAAQPGTRIEVYPGSYVGAIDIDKAVDLVGVGPREDIVLSAAQDHVIHWTAPSGRIANISLRQDGGQFYGIFFDAGSATLEDSDLTSKGSSVVAARGGAAPLIRNNVIHDGNMSGIFFYDGAGGTVEGNTIRANTYSGIEIKEGADPVIRRNVLRDGIVGGILVHTQGKGLIEDNQFIGNAYAGVEIREGSDPVVVRNVIRDGETSGIFVQEAASGRIEDNEIHNNGYSGVEIAEKSTPVLRGNTIRDNARSGIYLNTEARGRIENNTVFGNGEGGISIRGGADPVVRGNIIRDGTMSGIFVYDKGKGQIDGNEIHGNGYYGVEVTSEAQPFVRDNRITDNVWYGVRVYSGGMGTYQDNDLRGNQKAAFDLAEDAGIVTRVNNRE